MLVGIHPERHVHAACEGCLKQLVWTKPGFAATLVLGCVGNRHNLSVGKADLISLFFARSLDHREFDADDCSARSATVESMIKRFFVAVEHTSPRVVGSFFGKTYGAFAPLS